MKKLLLTITILVSSISYATQDSKRNFLNDSTNKLAIAEFGNLNGYQRRIVFKKLRDILSLVHIENDKQIPQHREEIKKLEKKLAPNLMKLINENHNELWKYFLENVENLTAKKVNHDAGYDPFNDEAWLSSDSKAQVVSINQNLFNLYEYFASIDTINAQHFPMHDKKVESIGYSRLTSQQ